MKQCVVCDSFLKEQRELYNNNHYLCSSDCQVFYVQAYNWSEGIIDINILNEIRKEVFSIDWITQNEVDRRID